MLYMLLTMLLAMLLAAVQEHVLQIMYPDLAMPKAMYLKIHVFQYQY